MKKRYHDIFNNTSRSVKDTLLFLTMHEDYQKWLIYGRLATTNQMVPWSKWE